MQGHNISLATLHSHSLQEHNSLFYDFAKFTLWIDFQIKLKSPTGFSTSLNNSIPESDQFRTLIPVRVFAKTRNKFWKGMKIDWKPGEKNITHNILIFHHGSLFHFYVCHRDRIPDLIYFDNKKTFSIFYFQAFDSTDQSHKSK